MKFQNQLAFEKYVASMRSLESIFMIVTSEDKERKDCVFRIKEKLSQKGQTFEVHIVHCGREPVSKLFESFDALSLFSPVKFIELHDAHLLSERDLMILKERLKSLDSKVLVAFLTKKAIPLPKELSSKTVILDLLAEKPWDHKKRIINLLVEYVRKAGKTISQEALEELVELVGIDYARLLQSVESLICFSADRRDIGINDLKSLSIARKKQKTWELAEYLTWGEGDVVDTPDVNDTELNALFMQVRYRLGVGIKIKEGICPEDISPSLYQKYRKLSELFSKEYFQKAFLEVYEIENLSRSGQFATSFLFDMLYVKLHQLRELYCLTTKQG